MLGHVLPLVGKDWSQIGITTLYNQISRNGYKFIYLSARAIGQSAMTRAYLRSVTQENNQKLPDGPLLLSPSSLVSAFHKSVLALSQLPRQRLPQVSISTTCYPSSLVSAFHKSVLAPLAIPAPSSAPSTSQY